MYCRKLKNGKWSCTVDATSDPLTGKRRQVTRRGDTKKEAMQRANKAADDLSSQRQVKKKLVHEVYEEWLDVYGETVKASSVRAREVALTAFLNRHGKHFIGKMQAKDIQDFLIDERDRGLSKNFLSSMRTALNLLFTFALKHDYIEKNIIKDSVIPKAFKRPNDYGVKKKYLEEDEIQYFLKGVKASERRNTYPLALMMLSTGLRIGEALSLTWEDIDLEKKTLEVKKTLLQLPSGVGGFEFSTPKTMDSNRTVSFNDELASELKKMKVQYYKEKLIGLRDPKSEWCDLEFTGRNQQPVRSSTINLVFNKIYKAYGIEGISGSHVLRHTHITMLVEAGVELPIIMERVGHSNINVTLEIYTHITKKMQEKSDEKINDYFRKYL